MNLEELKPWLESQGFRTANNQIRDIHNECHWYAYRRSSLPARECETNEGRGCQIVVYPHSIRFDSRTHESVEVEVCGEANGLWWKLMAYSILLDDLPSNLPGIEAGLVSAWNALKPAANIEQAA